MLNKRILSRTKEFFFRVENDARHIIKIGVMMRKTIISALVVVVAITARAQHLTVKNEVIDCGNVMYEQPVTACFELSNSGGTLFITGVRTSCGCIGADYPKSPVRDGGKFNITATYDARQLGHFSKDIAVYTNAADKPLYLTMRGVVVDEMTGYMGDYPFLVGEILADRNDIEFDDVSHGDRPLQKINIKNAGNEAISPVVMHLPPYLQASVSPTTIKPGGQGTVTLTLDSRRLRDFGLTTTSVFLGAFPGDKVSQDKEISVSAVLLPSFLDMTETDLATAPRLSLSQDTLDLGRFDGKSKKSGTILISNNGASELEISALQMFTEGLSVSLNKARLQPGEQAKLKVTAYSKEINKARSRPRVLMITNDPMSSKVVINVKVD